MVADAASSMTHLLDVGTGGGEVFADLAALAGVAVAIDHQPKMVHAARQRLPPQVWVVAGDGFGPPFAAASFDLVTNRHAQVDLHECARVLKPAGKVVIQQVGGRNMQSVFDAFSWGSNAQQWQMADRPPPRIGTLAATAERVGLTVEVADEYEVGYALGDLDSLVFILKAIPFPEPFDPVRHEPGVNRLIREYRSARGIETTEHREHLGARKSS
ncbi:hypothetical protein BH24ACT15_BH24ACT15_34710 [soil metagenome]